MGTGFHSIPDRSPLLLLTAQLPSCPNTTHLLPQIGTLPLYFLDCQGTCQVLRGPREQREHLIHKHTHLNIELKTCFRSQNLDSAQLPIEYQKVFSRHFWVWKTAWE